MKAMTCIAGLREQCPGEKASIDKSMTNLHGAESALKALCADDTIIEGRALAEGDLRCCLLRLVYRSGVIV